jgi:thioredoxin reductase (NADPH)
MVVLSNTTQEEINPLEKIIILGSGPAGLAAALYAARAELNPLVISGVELGGQAALTNTIENYPGFPEGIGGYELGELFKKQAERFGARVQFATAAEVDLQMNPFTVVTDSGKYKTSSLVIATGASPNHLNIPALFLTRFASSVKIIHRRDTLRAGALLQKRAIENPKISFVWNSVVEEINGEGKVTGLRIRNTRNGEENTLATDGIFIFIGHTPNTQLFDGQLSMDDKGFIKTNLLMETSVPGVFAAGEAADSHFRQVITSAGMGAAAAIQATHYLEDK